MKCTWTAVSVLLMFCLGLSAVGPMNPFTTGQAFGQTGDAAAAGPQVVEEDMHEFMEYYFQPTYKRLQKAMQAEPTDKAGWLEVKSAALILAEEGTLLLQHTPEDDGNPWNAHSTSVRTLGSKLYRAAREKNFAVAKQNYRLMLKSCNACHDEFAAGEHQLAP